MDADEIELENLKIINQHGSDALRAIFLLNGAASIATLTFLGSIAIRTSSVTISMSSVSSILFLFSLGAGTSVVSHSLNYLNLFSHARNFPKVGDWLLKATILAAFVSLALFFWGIWEASNVFDV
ncbi:MAG: hypothetical protein JKY49_04220 [Cohaesibacteraceae bacterium]|nr:hypothetical protein [Cohaesibacteraceae bacterium]